MKPYHPILIMVFAFLAACNGNKQAPELVEGPSVELAAIDSLLWRQPDSALACLLPYFDTCCRDAARQVSTVYNRHYAHLLLAELLYKNDYAQTNRAELLDAVGYFDSLTFTLNDHSSLRRLIAGGDPLSPTRNDQLFFLSARAHYINGVGYYEHDSVVPACKEFMKALEMMEGHFEEKELIGKKAQFMAMAYTRLLDLYSDWYLHEQTIYFGQLSLLSYQQYDATPWHVAWTLCEIGSQYEMKGIVDSAAYYYKKGVEILPSADGLTYRDLASRIAFLSYHQEGCDKSLIQLKTLLAQADSPIEQTTRCLTIGEIYFQEKEFDSAWLYLNEVFYGLTNTESKRQAAEWLVEICNATGKNDKVLEYANFLVPFANQEENKSEIKSQVTELYNKFSQNKLERQHQKEIRNRRNLSMMAYSVLLLVILVVVILYHYNKRRKLHLENQINEEKRAHILEKKSLSSRLKKSNASLRELQDQIKQQNDSDAKTELTISFIEEPVCRLIMERVKEGQFKSQMDCNIYKDFALSKEQLIALHDAANRHFAGLTMRLKKAYPQLTDSDLNYCCLYLLGLTDADVAALMQKAYPTVSQRSRKLKTIFGSETSLPITLHNFANNDLSH
ncbi:MAG: hypothetical protein IKO23_06305 [Bacteroidales bacterium]|nr:hypothetical protein [Bacteroidales bacterium]